MPRRDSSSNRVFCQRDLKRRTNVIPTSAEATIHGSYDDQKVEALLLGAHSPGSI
jgi:hypothetical protein